MKELGEGGRKVLASSYKITKFWGDNVQHDGYSYHISEELNLESSLHKENTL